MPRACDYGAKILLQWVGWCSFPPKEAISRNWGFPSMVKKVFADVIKDFEMKRLIRWALNPLTSILTREEKATEVTEKWTAYR